MFGLFGPRSKATDGSQEKRRLGVGLENTGNVCYLNAVLQVLFHCRPFRDRVITSGSATTATAPLTPANAPEIQVKTSASMPVLSNNINNNIRNMNKNDQSDNNAKDQSDENVTNNVGLNKNNNGLKRKGRPTNINTTNINNNINNININNNNASASPLTRWFDWKTPVDATTPIAENEDTLLSCLQTLFVALHHPNTATTTTTPNMTLSLPSLLSPSSLSSSLSSLSLTSSTASIRRAQKMFLRRLRDQNEMFRAPVQHDAHELLNHLLNTVADIIASQHRRMNAFNMNDPNKDKNTDKLNMDMKGNMENSHDKTWVHALFEGTLANETRCLTCDTVTRRLESFLDLSLDLDEKTGHSSLSHLLRLFSSPYLLNGNNKFFCDACCCLQEAHKRMLIHRLPPLLILHLKRFKFMERLQRHAKLSHRVSFPIQLRLSNTTTTCTDADRLYSLFAVIVHIGTLPTHGHYVSLIQTSSGWVLFDDEHVEPIHDPDSLFAVIFGTGFGSVPVTAVNGQRDDVDVGRVYGSMNGTNVGSAVNGGNSSGSVMDRVRGGTGYILFYQTV